jgi:transposase
VTRPAFPQRAKAPVQYGPRLHAMANYLAVHQHLPDERIVEHIRDIYGARVSVGTLVAMVNRGGQASAVGGGGVAPRRSVSLSAATFAWPEDRAKALKLLPVDR